MKKEVCKSYLISFECIPPPLHNDSIETTNIKRMAQFLENSKLPIKDIAQIVGVAEKTVYRWAAGAGPAIS